MLSFVFGVLQNRGTMEIISPKMDVVFRDLMEDDEVRLYFISDVLDLHILELRKTLKGDSRVDDWIRLFNVRTEEAKQSL